MLAQKARQALVDFQAGGGSPQTTGIEEIVGARNFYRSSRPSASLSPE
jgi:hypothetical protein